MFNIFSFLFQATISFARRFIFVFMLNGSMFLLFMVTYSCNGVIEHSDNVAIGAYSALWTIMPMDKFGKILRKDLIMVIKRSRRVCCLTANGFFPVSLETYTKVSIILIYSIECIFASSKSNPLSETILLVY